MDLEDLSIKFEELGVSSENVDEAIFLLQEELNKREAEAIPEDSAIERLENQLKEEKDWRKRASLVARLISLKL